MGRNRVVVWIGVCMHWIRPRAFAGYMSIVCVNGAGTGTIGSDSKQHHCLRLLSADSKLQNCFH